MWPGVQGGGIFCNPESQSAPAKLRLLYEAAPMAFIVEAAKGGSHDGHGSMLDRKIGSVSDKTGVSIGSKGMVEQSIRALQEG
jgi:fructose-1,6-bisphosphatase